MVQANFPSWMQFPDRERVGWINDLLSQLWPHAATAAAAKVRESLEPALAANKPRWMTDISLHTFTLGDAAPYVAAIKVHRSGPGGMVSPLTLAACSSATEGQVHGGSCTATCTSYVTYLCGH